MNEESTLSLDTSPVDTVGQPSSDPGDDPDLTATVERAVAHLRSRQAPAGWWKGELRTNVTMDAEDLLLRQFLDILDPADLAAAARWIRSQQRSDGTWANFVGGPADLSTTVEAYAALRLAGDPVDAPHMVIARDFVLAQGGLEATRVFTRLWLAMFGEWAWSDLPSMPPELVLLPSWVPLNVYDWACWARQTVVPITVVSTLAPVRPLPFTLDELRTHRRPDRPQPNGRRDRLIGSGFEILDRALKTYQRSPVQPGRQTAYRRAAEWIIARQEADGGWGGIQPPWVYSILALHLLGYPLDHPVLKAAIAGLEGFLVREDGPEGEIRRLEACQSPVWDTALALIGLLDAGVAPDDPAISAAVDWLLGEEVTVRGDWAVRRPDLAPGGWAFEFANDVYPDIDDTAEVVLALQRVIGARPERDADLIAAIERGVAWVTGMQSSDRGWAAFDADNTRKLAEKVPFSDFGAVIDPPTADVTAHVLEMYAALGDAESRPGRDARTWLLRHQESDGSWFGRWGVNHVYGTGAAVPALVLGGLAPESAPVQRAVAWLAEHQNADGGWGEDLRSYDDPEWIGRGTSTASQTAWALLALHAALPDGEPLERASGSAPASVLPWSARPETAAESGSAMLRTMIDRGVRYLVQTQQADGSWDEELFTGTGFPGDFYINYEMYRIVFPLAALGRLLPEVAAGIAADDSLAADDVLAADDDTEIERPEPVL